MERRRGFTLLELLVVLGIIAILLAVLLPVLTGIRGAARRTVCSSRLRDLTLACISYRQDHGRYPSPHPGAIPHQIQLSLINDLSPYLRYPLMQGSLAATELPVHIQCPFVEEVDIERGPLAGIASNDVPSYYTGYMYLAGLEQVAFNSSTVALSDGSSVAVLLKPDRAARATESRRAVIWADDLHLTLKPTPTWEFAHPFMRLVPEAVGFAGQHCAYTDGSVEWRPKDKLEITVEADTTRTVPGRGKKKLDEAASFRLGEDYYWWF
jgi:prepilin-type N-terminal cleavage/methylation domain-containing protein